MDGIRLFISLGTFAAITATYVSATQEEGVALAIVYDTSGSMKEQVRDRTGKPTPKYVIANRALEDIAARVGTFATRAGPGPRRKVHAGLFVFEGGGARQAVKFGPFDGVALKNWAQRFSAPGGGTPLGNALKKAGQAVLDSGLTRKHVLVITDGINTAGPDPATVLARLKQLAEQKQSTLSVHFVAFDVNAKVFDGVKKLGATVLGASDEAQLNGQLEIILEKKILLEDEEPPKKN
jgi:von Willebrand factor type A domain